MTNSSHPRPGFSPFGAPHAQPTSRLNLSSMLTGFALGAVVTMFASIAIVPDAASSDSGTGSFVLGPGDLELGEGDAGIFDDQGNVVVSPGDIAASDEAGGASGTALDVGGGGGSVSGGGAEGSGAAAAGSAECAPGKNGGETDTGVTGDRIKLGATVVQGGFAKAFLGEVWHSMEAVRKKVNRAGGICGRQLDILYKDDEWKPDRGKAAIENLIHQDKVFALAVSPSSEGLNQASVANVFTGSNVPVVGADGLNNTQFQDPMIWPVAAATTTTVHVLLQYAWKQAEAKGEILHPVIVFGNNYRFGIEGAHAFNEAYRELSGQNIPGFKANGTSCDQNSRYCGIAPNKSGNYGGEVATVNSACNAAPKCNFMLLLAEPQTAQVWMATPNAQRPSGFTYGMSGAQPLFTFGFADTCDDACDGMLVWTGYNPPLEQFAVEGYEPTRNYVNDVHAENASADQFNQFTEGGYVGMQLMVEALKATGANLTRKGLADTLNSMKSLETGLTVPLQWKADKRYANHSAHAFRINAANGFTGNWSYVSGSLTRDPWLGQHANV